MIKEYLINKICTFKPMFEVRKEKIDILSSCLFNIKNLDGLQDWADYLNKPNNNYILRLFVDQPIYDNEKIQKILSSCPYIEIIVCEDILNGLIRFFPLFNFKYNDSKSVTIVDIDLNFTHRLIVDVLLKTNMSKIILKTSNLFDISSAPHFVTNIMHFPDKKFNKKILLDFIKNKTYKKISFPIDNIFLNNYLIRHITNASYISVYNPLYFLCYYDYYEMIIDNKDSFKYMKFILGKYAKKTLDEMTNFIDNIYVDAYNDLNKFTAITTNKNIYISKRFYKFLRYSIKNNISWIPLGLIKLIIDNYNNIIFTYSIIELNLKTKKIVKITNIKPIMLN
jgi:hypothetical protein